MRFPPIVNRSHFERSGYLKSFPHLAGSVHSFAGDEREHRELLDAVEEGRDWSAALPHAGRGAHARGVLSRLSRCSRDSLPAGGRLVDVMSYCFRHEPSDDAGTDADVPHARARSCRRPGAVVSWREAWLERARASDRGTRARRALGSRLGSVFRPRRQAAGGQPARSAPQARDRGADRQRRAADGDHLAQLPPGPLRPASSASAPPTARSPTPRASASGSSGWPWPSIADTASTAPRGRDPVREALGL